MIAKPVTFQLVYPKGWKRQILWTGSNVKRRQDASQLGHVVRANASF